MANLNETTANEYAWTDGVYQLEITDPVNGGADGIANRQASQLSLRTRNLHNRAVISEAKIADVPAGSTAVGLVRGGVPLSYDTLMKLYTWVNEQLQALGGGDPLTGAEVRDLLVGLLGEERLDAAAIKNLPTAGESMTAVQIRDALSTLVDTNRLGAAAIKDLIMPYNAVSFSKVTINNDAGYPRKGAFLYGTHLRRGGTYHMFTAYYNSLSTAESPLISVEYILDPNLRLGTNATSRYQKNQAIGSGASVSGEGAMALGNGAVSTVTNQIVIGSASAIVKLGDGAVVTSDRRDKTAIEDNELGLDFLRKVKTRKWLTNPRELYLKRDGTGNLQLQKGVPVIDEEAHAEGRLKGKRWHRGVVSQEIEECLEEAGMTGTDFCAVKDTTVNESRPHLELKSMDYLQFVAPLIKAVQELDAEVRFLKTKLNEITNGR
jgi:hypothetical protein